MNDFFAFLELNFKGILILLLILFVIIFLIRWIAQIFAIGKFKKSDSLKNKEPNDNITHLISNFIVNIIDDFRHLLALIVILLFAFLIIFSMASTSHFRLKMEALQLVIASLGGLVGSIIGYYYGESAASKTREEGVTASPTTITQADDPIIPDISNKTKKSEEEKNSDTDKEDEQG